MYNNRKNVLLLIPTFADEGGTQKMVNELGKLLTEQFNVFECSYNALEEPHIFKNNNLVLSLDSPHNGSLIDKLTGYPRKIIRLRQIKKKYKIDITISNLWSADLINILSGTNDKTISIGHSSVVGNPQSRLLLKYHKLGKFIYNKFDKIVAVNETLMQELSRLFEIPHYKICFINNFISFPKNVIKKENLYSPKKRLVNVGRLHSGKNLEPLLIIFKSLQEEIPFVQIVFVGNGPLELQLKEFAKALGFRIGTTINDIEADVVFTGFLDPFPILVNSDIFVFPSKSEGLPLVIVEAMHAGLPIVASDCPTGGPHVILEAKSAHQPDRREVEETKYGYLMPIPIPEIAGTMEQWKLIISELLNNENKRLQLGFQAKERSLDFSVDTIKYQWFNIINDVL